MITSVLIKQRKYHRFNALARPHTDTASRIPDRKVSETSVSRHLQSVLQGLNATFSGDLRSKTVIYDLCLWGEMCVAKNSMCHSSNVAGERRRNAWTPDNEVKAARVRTFTGQAMSAAAAKQSPDSLTHVCTPRLTVEDRTLPCGAICSSLT